MNLLHKLWASTKQTLGFKRLFWRIFIAFWFTSLLAILATGFVIINETSSSEIHNRYLNNISTQAERIIWRFENDAFFDIQKLATKIENWRNKKDRIAEHLLPMSIFDRQNQLVYRFRMKREKLENMMNVEVVGPSGQLYSVYAPPPEPPRMLKQLFYRFQSLQFIFIFIASAIVSALLSWSIVRPLNQLGQFSRQYANEQKPSVLTPKLLNRGDELGDLAVDIDFMVRTTHQSANAQQQLLYDVSHELRAPLARLQVSAALIEQKMPNNRHALQINSDCVRIDQLIQQILNYSKLDHTDETPRSFDVITHCQHIVDNLAVQFPDHQLIFHAELNELLFLGFEEPLKQALENIIGNACKYSPSEFPVEISLSHQVKQSITIEVRDHGKGVDEKEKSQLLQPFYRAGNQMHTPGFGLGLSIAARAVLKHKGKLSMENHPQGGLVVSLVFPIT